MHTGGLYKLKKIKKIKKGNGKGQRRKEERGRKSEDQGRAKKIVNPPLIGNLLIVNRSWNRSF